jgi:HPt (histidine-containing phosphotransfer) domain-containing protein
LPTALPKFQRIVDEFVVKLETKLNEMTAARDAGRWNTLAELAHWLKGSGGTVGFDCLTAPAAELEQSAKNQDAAAADRALDQLRLLANRIAFAVV